MKKIQMYLIRTMATGVASMALFMGINSISPACFLCFNQPKMPEEILKFKK
ncbi:cyclic lactone autoinducer peptide [Anaeropeptidivorans aminofermentans]|jgi:cyclic lactone autoinducer peptide|uniref:cyclic lactone autoinducer peptide n=1 Tax=Anaeropeptidivorans aminofermentans TaxID=2934315 RepID=UPI0020251260|nr:cyclic lactone autoinducer peptide [Anaeropeptidivorans aminofermentans]MBE6011402.1 cyclic lactone autoinducer peptide [Lachnospiraceae bacterium]